MQQGLPIEESIHETKGQAKAIDYLRNWETDRQNWKFEKCRQIWLLHVSGENISIIMMYIKVPQNAYDETRVPDDIFPTLLKYMESIKGGMRNLALDIANKKLEEKVEEEEPEPEDKEKQVCCKIS